MCQHMYPYYVKKKYFRQKIIYKSGGILSFSTDNDKR